MTAPQGFCGPHQDPRRYRLIRGQNLRPGLELWSATQTSSNHEVTVSVISGVSESWPGYAEALMTIDEPGLAPVLDGFTGPHPTPGPVRPAGETGFLVCARQAGLRLDDWLLANEGSDLNDRLSLLRAIAAGLDVLHGGAADRRLLAHASVSVRNVRVSPDGSAVLFGLGAEVGAERAEPSQDAYDFAVLVAETLLGAQAPAADDGSLDLIRLQHQLSLARVARRRPGLVHEVLSAIS